MGEIESLEGLGEGAGGFISIAPRVGGRAGFGGEGGCFLFVRDLEGGEGERDLDRDS